MSGDSVSSSQDLALACMPIQVTPTNRAAEILRIQIAILDNLAIDTTRDHHEERPDEHIGKSLSRWLIERNKIKSFDLTPRLESPRHAKPWYETKHRETRKTTSR